QRFSRVDRPSDTVDQDLLDRVVGWLGADGARLVMVLADFGHGKTFLLRQLARVLPERLPGTQPLLVELRGLEKAPSLDELLGQHLIRSGVEEFDLEKLRYMIRSGRLTLLFDGFDELAVRVNYDEAVQYLRTLLAAVTDRAHVVVTSRTSHFQSDQQVLTALGDAVTRMTTSRVVVVTDFEPGQIRRFLLNQYRGDAAAADARYRLLEDVHDLLGLSGNPRMLSFISHLPEERLRAVHRKQGRISAAELYRELVDFWLIGEARRHRHHGGLPSLDEKDRDRACRVLALRLWQTGARALSLADLGAEVTRTLDRLAERGYTADQAAHSVASG